MVHEFCLNKAIKNFFFFLVLNWPASVNRGCGCAWQDGKWFFSSVLVLWVMFFLIFSQMAELLFAGIRRKHLNNYRHEGMGKWMCEVWMEIQNCRNALGVWVSQHWQPWSEKQWDSRTKAFLHCHLAKITVAAFQRVWLPIFMNQSMPGQISHRWLTGEENGQNWEGLLCTKRQVWGLFCSLGQSERWPLTHGETTVSGIRSWV